MAKGKVLEDTPLIKQFFLCEGPASGGGAALQGG